MIKIYNMDVMKALKQMPDESVDMQICSPPYWGLRSYGKDVEIDWGDGYIGELGLEPDFNLFIKHLADIFDEVKRVLKRDGTCWVNLSDTYMSSGSPTRHHGYVDPKYKEGRKIEYLEPHSNPQHNVQPKSLTCIPERFMIEMINRGWILRNKIIWYKRNHMPTSVKDRMANSWEYLFFFSKSQKYFFDLDAIREPHKTESVERTKNKWKGHREPGTSYAQMDMKKMCHPSGKNPGDVIQTKFSDETQLVKNVGISSMSARLRKDGEEYTPNEKGKNPGEIITSKYVNSEGHSNRAGFQREPTLREKRIHEVIQCQIANYLKPKTKGFEKILDEKFGKHKWTHWIRTDKSGASLPSPEDWLKLKEILDFDNKFDEMMTETEVYLDDGMMWKNKPKNPSDFWDITTRGYPEAHFAVFPKALIERPIKTTRKNAVIMDIFAGSGTTLEVARDLHRNSIGIEIKEDYVKLIKKRLFKGNQPLINNFEVIK